MTDGEFFGKEWDAGYDEGLKGCLKSEAVPLVEKKLGRTLREPERCQVLSGWWTGNQDFEERKRRLPPVASAKPAEPLTGAA